MKAGALVVAVLIFLVSPLLWTPPEVMFAGIPFASPSWDHPLGTDHLGRDLLLRILLAGQTTIAITTTATLLSFMLGLLIAVASSLAPGLVGSGLSRLMDVLIAIPGLVLAFVLIAGLGASTTKLIMVITIVEFCRSYRVLKAPITQTISLRFVEISRLRGEGLFYIAWRDVWPNIRPYAAVELVTRFVASIMFLSALSVLGVGVQPPSTDWGTLIKENASGLLLGSFAPIIPGLFIVVLSFLALSLFPAQGLPGTRLLRLR